MNNFKKILFIWIHPLKPNSGGIERVTSVVMDGLEKINYDCHYLQFIEWKNEFIYLGNVISNFNYFISSNKFDVIVNQDGYSSSVTQYINSSLWSGSYIVFYHNDPKFYLSLYNFERSLLEILGPDKSILHRLGWILRILFYPIRKFILVRKLTLINNINYEKCNYYVLLSESYFKNFKCLSNNSNLLKLKAINNPLSFDVKYGIDDIQKKNKEVLIVSRMDEAQKRISYCLEIWRHIEMCGFEDWILNIVGDGPDLPYYKNLALNLGLKRVIFHGNSSPINFYNSASIFMMTSRTEGWGLTLTESLQTGVVPIVMDSYLSLHDIIINHYNGIIIKNNNISAFVKELMNLMLNKNFREKIALNCVKSSIKFSKENILSKWLTILND